MLASYGYETQTLLAALNDSPEKSLNSLRENRLTALNLFCGRHNNGDGAVTSLDSAFRVLYGHWVNGERPKESLQKILSRLSNKEPESLCSIKHYRSSFVKLQGTTPPVKRKYGTKAVCLVHPNRKAIARELCNPCYSKAFRLNLLHLPMDQWLITLLKKRKPRDKRQCVNHAKVAAYADGLCVECLRKVGKLDGVLGTEVCYAV